VGCALSIEKYGKLGKEVDGVIKEKNVTFEDAINRPIFKKRQKINIRWATEKLT
jgi:hypothetical protein